MSLILNVVWLLLAGVWVAAGYAVAGFVLAVTVVGIPFAVQLFKLAGFALWPFGRAVVPAQGSSPVLSAVGNLIWFFLVGWWLALAHIVTGLVLCITIIGLPMGLACSR